MPRLNGKSVYLDSVKPQNIAQIRGWSIKTKDSFFLNNSTLMASTDDLAILISSLNHQFYMIYDRSDKPLGVLLLSNIHNPRQIAEIGLTMQPSKNNTKLLGDALETVLTNTFSKTKLNKIYCHCLTHEQELKKILLDYMFKKEGQFKEHLYFNDQYNDQEIFGLSKEDYYK